MAAENRCQAGWHDVESRRCRLVDLVSLAASFPFPQQVGDRRTSASCDAGASCMRVLRQVHRPVHVR
jgi:hypothetical protein